mmetsp:Transcript_51711/g.136688  ORF Transcript_51711/g.136688 Transcript_51711/m.136688 type:complete len:205 (-) Transcript_51711:1240-1854(-)
MNVHGCPSCSILHGSVWQIVRGLATHHRLALPVRHLKVLVRATCDVEESRAVRQPVNTVPHSTRHAARDAELDVCSAVLGIGNLRVRTAIESVALRRVEVGPGHGALRVESHLRHVRLNSGIARLALIISPVLQPQLRIVVREVLCADTLQLGVGDAEGRTASDPHAPRPRNRELAINPASQSILRWRRGGPINSIALFALVHR